VAVETERAAQGRIAEEIAARYLLAKGYEILARNARFRSGELDIVARRDGEVVVVEVRSRRRGSLISPEASITATKRRRLTRAAEVWLGRHGLGNAPCRFDVIAVVAAADGYRVRHWPGAFGADE
jgi:putative endonuclease